MKDKLKKFFTDPFNWNIAAAVLSIICTGLFMWQAEYLLATIWAIISGIDIAMAYMENKRRK